MPTLEAFGWPECSARSEKCARVNEQTAPKSNQIEISASHRATFAGPCFPDAAYPTCRPSTNLCPLGLCKSRRALSFNRLACQLIRAYGQIDSGGPHERAGVALVSDSRTR